IVAGFQGMSRKGEITTLGRGGSDTTAVALAITLGASQVEFYKDVPGIFENDPKHNPNARHIPEISYENAYEMAQKGAKVLHARAIDLAQKNGIQLIVRSFQKEGETIVGKSAFRSRTIQFETESEQNLS
ncbi:MAG: aspartate kinase, partial [Chlamydiae bacterium]|nr:aspartate kinase [Chlamydiota bacterium]